MNIVPHACASNRVLIHRSYTFIHRTKYIYIEITHIYIEPNTHMPKLHLYNGTVQRSRNAFVHIEIIRVYFELFTFVCRAFLYEVLNRENFHINRNFGQLVSGYISRDPKQDEKVDEKDVGKKPANWLRTGAILPFFARLVNPFTWGELVIRLCGISLPKTWWFRKNTKRFVFKVIDCSQFLRMVTRARKPSQASEMAKNKKQRGSNWAQLKVKL